MECYMYVCMFVCIHFDVTTGKQLSDSHIALGNKLLVYISCCLAGRAYPLSGDIPAEDNQRVRHEVFKCLTCLHSKNAADSEQPYPYLRYIESNFSCNEGKNTIVTM
jgi:hypothetical protein